MPQRPGPALPAPDNDPVPLAADADVQGHVKKPDTDPTLPPTGRDEPKPYTPNDRLMGADR